MVIMVHNFFRFIVSFKRDFITIDEVVNALPVGGIT